MFNKKPRIFVILIVFCLTTAFVGIINNGTSESTDIHQNQQLDINYPQKSNNLDFKNLLNKDIPYYENQLYK